MVSKTLASRAAAIAASRHKVKNPIVIDHIEATHGESRQRLHRFRVIASDDANGHAHDITLDDRGEPFEADASHDALFDRHRTVIASGAVSPVAAVTIDPNTNTLTLNPGDTFNETLTVTIPKSAAVAKADVYFLADTTGSMTDILNAVKTGANSIQSALNGLGIDIAFGVGNYKDFASGDPFGFQHQVSPTNSTPAVTAGINAWNATGGGDTPEAALFALESLAVAPGGAIGWRSASKRIIAWFGDAPSHDPICTAVTGAPTTVTEATATAKLAAQGIVVLAISTATPGLDDDPHLGASGYAACGGPGGAANQATHIAAATGGTFVTGINAGNIANTIVSLVSGTLAGIDNVKLVPSASVAPFVTSLTPAAGYGPLPGDKDHTLTFDITFTGTAPCTAKSQVVTGSIDVVIDGTVVTRKEVQITIPPCAFVYSVKFICGTQPECDCECSPVQPGTYATEINIHNYSTADVRITRRVIPVMLAGAPAGRAPLVAKSRSDEQFTLPAQSATMEDCCHLNELILGGPPGSPAPLTIGLLELTASADIAITAVYTASSGKGAGPSIRVEQIVGRRL